MRLFQVLQASPPLCLSHTHSYAHAHKRAKNARLSSVRKRANGARVGALFYFFLSGGGVKRRRTAVLIKPNQQ